MIFAVKAIPNWMTIGRILATPVVAVLIASSAERVMTQLVVVMMKLPM